MEDEPGVSEHSGGSVVSVVDENRDFVAEKLDDFVSRLPLQHKYCHGELQRVSPKHGSPLYLEEFEIGAAFTGKYNSQF